MKLFKRKKIDQPEEKEVEKEVDKEVQQPEHKYIQYLYIRLKDGSCISYNVKTNNKKTFHNINFRNLWKWFYLRDSNFYNIQAATRDGLNDFRTILRENIKEISFRFELTKGEHK